ncbi:MAG: glycosyltransferase family 4 protein [Verrucomicrobiia bacterium]
MRIVLYHSGSDLYGASRVLWRFTRRLVSEGHQILVVLPSSGPLLPRLQDDGIPSRVDPFLPILQRKILGSWRAIPFLVKLPFWVLREAWRIRKFRADVVYSNTGTLLGASLAAWIIRCPHVWQMREMFEEFGPLWNPYARWILASSRSVACVSRAVADQFSRFRGGGKAVVVHDGFPPEEFVSDPALHGLAWNIARRETRANWGLAEAEVAIGLLGRIKLGRKGQEVLVRAARQLLHRRGSEESGSPPRFRVVIVGAPFPGNEDHETQLRELVGELGCAAHVIFAGEMDDPRPAYAALDVVVLASARPEPFGGVVIEAMAMGKPVVGTAIGGTVEQIEEGVTGFLVPPNDPVAMAEALARLIADPALRARMGAAGRQRFEAKFGFEEMYHRLLAIYGEALRKETLGKCKM